MTEIVDSSPYEAKLHTPGLVVVLVAQRVHITRELYDRAGLIMPMKFLSRPGHLGKTSYSSYLDFVDPTDGATLLRCQNQSAYIDGHTRKLAPLPDVCKDLLRELVDPEAEPVYYEDRKLRGPIFTASQTVQHSDTDNLYHTNHTSYIKFCMNAAAEASQQDKLSDFQGDFFSYPLSDMTMRYHNETRPGDHLQVSLWQDHPLAMHFKIMKDTVSVFSASCSFFDRYLPSKL